MLDLTNVSSEQPYSRSNRLPIYLPCFLSWPTLALVLVQATEERAEKCAAELVRRRAGARRPGQVDAGAQGDEQDPPVDRHEPDHRDERRCDDPALHPPRQRRGQDPRQHLQGPGRRGRRRHTSVCVLAAELLREAEKLIEMRIHPQTVVEGYRIASAAALRALDRSAVDNGGNADKFREDLMNIARTTLSPRSSPPTRTTLPTLLLTRSCGSR